MELEDQSHKSQLGRPFASLLSFLLSQPNSLDRADPAREPLNRRRWVLTRGAGPWAGLGSECISAPRLPGVLHRNPGRQPLPFVRLLRAASSADEMPAYR